jgi:hypothetical protein
MIGLAQFFDKGKTRCCLSGEEECEILRFCETNPNLFMVISDVMIRLTRSYLDYRKITNGFIFLDSGCSDGLCFMRSAATTTVLGTYLGLPCGGILTKF